MPTDRAADQWAYVAPCDPPGERDAALARAEAAEESVKLLRRVWDKGWRDWEATLAVRDVRIAALEAELRECADYIDLACPQASAAEILDAIGALLEEPQTAKDAEG